jgi:hypothetical protein
MDEGPAEKHISGDFLAQDQKHPLSTILRTLQAPWE